MGVVFSNNCATTLSSAISTSDTTIAVADASAFPTLSGSDYTYATLEDLSNNVEVVKVTAISGNTLTVTRAQDGTTARAFASGDRCQLRLNAALLNDATFSRSFNDLTDVPTSQFTDAKNTKLAGIETAATADQTGAEIKALYEAETSAFTDAQFTKLAGIETGATADQTGSQIKALYEAQNSAFTDAQFTKLAGIETGATADQTGSEIKALYEAESSAFTDAQFTKLAGIETGATADQTAAEIKSLYEGTANAWTYAQFTKLAGIETGADVTDTVNVTAAGALMDSELDDLMAIKTLTAPNGTDITSFGKDIVGGADAAAVRTTLGLTDAHIKSAYEANSNTNAFTDDDHSKLDSIEASATADQTASEIRTLVGSATDSNVFTDALAAKLNAIETYATADQTSSEIESLYNNAVAQVSSSEISAGTSSTIKRFTPADVKSMITTHASSSLSDNQVTLAKMADIATASFIGRNTSGTGDPEILSADTARGILNHSNDLGRCLFAKYMSNSTTKLVDSSEYNIEIWWDATQYQIKYKATSTGWSYIDGSMLHIQGTSGSTNSATVTAFANDISSNHSIFQYISNNNTGTSSSPNSTFNVDDNYGSSSRFTLIKESHGSGFAAYHGIVFIGNTGSVAIQIWELGS